MIPAQHITSFQDHPLLAPYLTMKRQDEQRVSGLFVAEGHWVVERLLKSDLEVVSTLMPEHWLEKLEPLLAARANVHCFTAPKALLEQLTGFQLYQGVLATARVPTAPSLDQLLSATPTPYAFLALDGISNSDNIGTLIRSAAAFGIQAVLTSNTSCSPFLRRSVRTSMGAVFTMPILEGLNLPDALATLKAYGTRIIAAHPQIDCRTLNETSMAGDCCVVLGSEGPGITPRILELADERVAIPMMSAVDSINVSSAGAIFMYELARQRAQVALSPIRGPLEPD